MTKRKIALFFAIFLFSTGILTSLWMPTVGLLMIAGCIVGLLLLLIDQTRRIQNQLRHTNTTLTNSLSSNRWAHKKLLDFSNSIFTRVKKLDHLENFYAPPATTTTTQTPASNTTASTTPTASSKTQDTVTADKLLAPAPPSYEKTALYTPDIMTKKWIVDHELMLRSSADLPQSLYYATPDHKPIKDVKAALICDQFTFNSFKDVFTSIAISPTAWRQQFESFQPDILFVESAWSGVPATTRPWKAKIYSSIRFHYENRTELFAILAYCKKRNIPTIFWNKEDPTHFNDHITGFVDTASYFDYIFTTAEECLSNYQQFHPRENVGILQFAASPSIFNPLGNQAPRENKVVFPGSWYRIHKNRSEEMRSIFNTIRNLGLTLEMYDRYYGKNIENFKVPDDFFSIVRPSVTHERTADLYRSSNYTLNINTVVDSRTMFARRIFEAAACGSHIITNDSPGIERIFGSTVTFTRDLHDPDALKENRQRALTASNIVLKGHTYHARAESVLDLLKIPYFSSHMTTNVVAIVENDAECNRVLERARTYGTLCSRIILFVSDSVPEHRIQEYFRKFGKHNCVVVSQGYWRKRDIQESSILTTPAWLLIDPNSTFSRDQLEKALAHHQYCSQPIKASMSLEEPRTRIGRCREDALFPAGHLREVILNGSDFYEFLEV
ncbi:spore maturation protein CgeB [Arcanobacterium pluranimalium]|uniref:CgeB family protein n=1 Tax=Arcanobacterium pluranimalium TaxID=108028 RepID=UPI0019566C6A|nr:glycosyltransferase [Arcanobacterium pluranimalium]MBM7824612.1 spore maturation protein CgeB [Arcanobacterium pluranimalium]